MRIVDFDGTQPIFETETLEALLKTVAENQVFVISIIGPYRTGKSFLLDLLKSYLDYIAQVNLNSQHLFQDLIFKNKWPLLNKSNSKMLTGVAD